MACTSVSYENNCLLFFIFLFFGLSEFWQKLCNIYQIFWLERLWCLIASQSHDGLNNLLHPTGPRPSVLTHLLLQAYLQIYQKKVLKGFAWNPTLLLWIKVAKLVTHFLHECATMNTIPVLIQVTLVLRSSACFYPKIKITMLAQWTKANLNSLITLLTWEMTLNHSQWVKRPRWQSSLSELESAKNTTSIWIMFLEFPAGKAIEM